MEKEHPFVKNLKEYYLDMEFLDNNDSPEGDLDCQLGYMDKDKAVRPL
jgi:hypothetical protein